MEQDLFNVIVLGVVFDPAKRKILIGRREDDLNLKELTWSFPGGRLGNGEEIDKTVKNQIKLKTGLEIKNLGSIFSKIYPEKGNLLAIYFLCEAVGGEEKAGDLFKEIKWVNPDEVEGYFKVSFHSRLKEYILNLQ